MPHEHLLLNESQLPPTVEAHLARVRRQNAIQLLTLIIEDVGIVNVDLLLHLVQEFGFEDVHQWASNIGALSGEGVPCRRQA